MKPVGDKTPTLLRRMVIFTPFLLYPSIDFIFRITNGIIAPELSIEFALNAAEIGFVSSIFFIAFGLVQLPLGVALDRFGPRNTSVCILTVAVIGALIFIYAEGLEQLIVGRMLLGVGMAGSLIAGIKTASLWLSGRLSLATFMLIGSTGIGGMIGTVPFSELLTEFPWRQPFLGLTSIIVLLCVGILIFVPTNKFEPTIPISHQFLALSHIFQSNKLWQYAPIAMTCIGVGSAYQTLWAPLWLRDVAGFTVNQVAWVMLGMLGNYALGNLAFGWITQTLQRYKKSVMPAVISATILFIFCQILIVIQITSLDGLLWIIASFLLAGPYAIYPIITANFPETFTARASSVLNFLVFTSIFSLQWLIGLIINLFPEIETGIFSPLSYSWAMGFCIAIQILGLGWYVIFSRFE